MIYAATREEIVARRKAFIRKWRLKHRAVADSLEEAGDRLFTFTRLPPSQWRSALLAFGFTRMIVAALVGIVLGAKQDNHLEKLRQYAKDENLVADNQDTEKYKAGAITQGR